MKSEESEVREQDLVPSFRSDNTFRLGEAAATALEAAEIVGDMKFLAPLNGGAATAGDLALLIFGSDSFSSCSTAARSL